METKFKKTVYFNVDSGVSETDVQKALQDLCKKRDEWMRDNNELISKIDSEDIKMSSHTTHRVHITIILILSYYPK